MNRSIVIPLNSEVIIVKNSNNNPKECIEWILSDDVFMKLWESGIFKIFNKKFNIIIDDYESESIDATNLQEAIKIVEEQIKVHTEIKPHLEKLQEFLTKAIELNTRLDFQF